MPSISVFPQALSCLFVWFYELSEVHLLCIKRQWSRLFWDASDQRVYDMRRNVGLETKQAVVQTFSAGPRHARTNL